MDRSMNGSTKEKPLVGQCEDSERGKIRMFSGRGMRGLLGE